MDLWPESPTVVGPCSPYAPVLDNVYTQSMAWMIPSLVAPTRTETSISWRGVEAVWLSVREKIILDGRPVFQVTKAGKISETTVCFARSRRRSWASRPGSSTWGFPGRWK